MPKREQPGVVRAWALMRRNSIQRELRAYGPFQIFANKESADSESWLMNDDDLRVVRVQIVFPKRPRPTKKKRSRK